MMRLRKGLVVSFVSLLVLLLLYFLLRNTLVQTAFERMQLRSYQSYGLRLSTEIGARSSVAADNRERGPAGRSPFDHVWSVRPPSSDAFHRRT